MYIQTRPSTANISLLLPTLQTKERASFSSLLWKAMVSKLSYFCEAASIDGSSLYIIVGIVKETEK